MDAVTQKPASSSPSASVTAGERIRQMLLVIAITAAAAGAAYYALTIARANAFSNERAFRVLSESVGQFANLQESMASLLKAVPQDLKTSCVEGESSKPLGVEQCRQNYQSRLALPEVKLENRPQKSDFRCKQVRQDEVVLRLNDHGVGMTIWPCSRALSKGGNYSLRDQKYVVSGNLDDALERFVAQSFFDSTLLALDGGRVLAELSPRMNPDSADRGVALQEPTAQRLLMTDVAVLLARAAESAQNAAKKDAGARKDPQSGADEKKLGAALYPAVLDEEIAGEKYRIFIMAFRPTYPLYTVTNEGATPVAVDTLYLVGLKREQLTKSIAYALWPTGTFAITVLGLLAAFAWPIVSLRLSPPQDPIYRMEALACIAALILVPALLTIAAAWAWSNYTLTAWAKDGAARYAVEVEKALIDELSLSANLLTEYREVADSKAPLPRQLPVRKDTLVVPTTRLDGVHYLWTNVDSDTALGSWSPLRSVTVIDEAGNRQERRLTAFGEMPKTRPVTVAYRPYFQAVKSGAVWNVAGAEQWREPPAQGFVAQRLFNRIDAARVLQIAVPRKCATGGTFCGILTGDTRVHALTAGVDPPLLRFAVIDRNSGTVLFHSDESRSLAENFFVETEQDVALRTAMQLGQQTHFDGRYVGDPYGFFVKPMEGLPWSVVAFYPQKQLGDLSLQAAIAALTVHTGCMLLVLCVFAVLLLSRSKPAERGLECLWPQWRWRRRYHHIGWSLCGVALLVFVYGLLELPTAHAVLVASTLAVPASGWAWRRSRTRPLRRRREDVPYGATPPATETPKAVQRYEQAYLRCVVGLLFLISVAPAFWLTLGYHDVQVLGLLREGLMHAAADVEGRHAVIDADLRRWVPNESDRKQRYPDPWVLVTSGKVPGYEAVTQGNTQRWMLKNVFPGMPWARTGSHAPDTTLEVAWTAAARSPNQLRRARVLQTATWKEVQCSPTEERSECYQATAPDGHAIEIATALTANRAGVTSPNTIVYLLLVSGGILVIVAILARSVARRMLGLSLPFAARYLPVLSKTFPNGLLFYRPQCVPQRVDVETLRKTLLAIPKSQYIDLASSSKARLSSLAGGDYLLSHLDVAIFDVERRRMVLNALEDLLSRRDLGIYMVCQKSPFQWLHHTEHYPELQLVQCPVIDEERRWDEVLSKLIMVTFRREVERGQSPALPAELHEIRRDAQALRSQSGHLTDRDESEYLAVHGEVYYHRAWKLCTREERLVLHQVATGRFINQANDKVIERLIRHGFLDLKPWPVITDPAFARFVRTAESAHDFHEWQLAASASLWRSVRTPILIALLVVVGWVIYAAGDYVQTFSGILVAALALLGHIGQAVNVARGNIAPKSS